MDTLNKANQWDDKLAHGFKRGRSIVSNGAKHRKRRYVFKLDPWILRNRGRTAWKGERSSWGLADSAAIAKFAESVKSQFPDLNVLVNNAGIAGLEDYTADSIDLTRAYSTIQTNITGVVQLSAALLPTLRAQPQSTLIVTTSGLAFVPYPPGSVYSATKAFMHNWLDALRVQLRKTSVEVLELAPPYVQTELGGPQQASDPRAMPLDEFTKEVVQILEHNTIEKGEILVEKVRPLRTAEKDGKYQDFLDMFAVMHD